MVREMLTGKLPFEGRMHHVMFKVSQGEKPSIENNLSEDLKVGGLQCNVTIIMDAMYHTDLLILMYF